jgi:hypothetical protein
MQYVYVYVYMYVSNTHIYINIYIHTKQVFSIWEMCTYRLIKEDYDYHVYIYMQYICVDICMYQINTYIYTQECVYISTQEALFILFF